MKNTPLHKLILAAGRLNAIMLVQLLYLVACVDSTALVSLENDRLSYKSFPMQGQTNAVNRIPDFSHAGYKGGGVMLPEVPIVKTLSASGIDDRQLIQQAIDKVSALPLSAEGFRGAIRLASGSYQLDGPLYIKNSGVVLLGEGQAENGVPIANPYKKEQ